MFYFPLLSQSLKNADSKAELQAEDDEVSSLQSKFAPRPTVLPLSMQLMRQFSGMCCPNCWGEAYTPRQGDTVGSEIDLDLLTCKRASVSSMVWTPMMTSSSVSDRETLLADYLTACRFYRTEANSGVLTTLRYGLPCLRAMLNDADMLALCEVLMQHSNGALRTLERLDFTANGSQTRFTSHGALALAKVLQQSEHIVEVRLNRNRVGAFGASSLFVACAHNPNLRRLYMRRCRIGQRGALAFAQVVVPASETGLLEVDLSANYIGQRGCVAIDRALQRRSKLLIVDLEGNLVFQEVMNGVTHGLGILLAAVGAWLLMVRMQGAPLRHVLSCGVYSASLIVLYTSSTLYHSFFTMQHVKYIFEVLDKCAIYILIAGSYTPFLQITLSDQPLYSTYLLAFIWLCGIMGIAVEASYPAWRYKGLFSLAMYLGMGWTALICLPQVARLLPRGAIHVMMLGGVAYTAGIPFFVRNNHLDHAIWHVFVLLGSFLHWFGIYRYVVADRSSPE